MANDRCLRIVGLGIEHGLVFGYFVSILISTTRSRYRLEIVYHKLENNRFS